METSATVQIDSPIDEVWRAITTPEFIKRWFFGVDTETDWKVGSPIVHRGEYRGKPYEDRGTIERFEPPNLLVHTHWSAVSGQPDRPEHYQRVTWSLDERGQATALEVAEEGIPDAEAKQVSEQAWGTALTALKELVEQPAD